MIPNNLEEGKHIIASTFPNFHQILVKWGSWKCIIKSSHLIYLPPDISSLITHPSWKKSTSLPSPNQTRIIMDCKI